MVTDRRALAEPQFAYLGWYIEGAAAKGVFPLYTWYAWEDGTERQFRVSVDARFDWGEAKEAGRLLVKGKVFLQTWTDTEEYTFRLPLEPKSASTRDIGNAVLKGLYRLYEGGWAEGDAPIDMESVAAELGVTRELFMRALKRLLEDGSLQKGRELHTGSWPIGNFWLSSAGATVVEERILGLTDQQGSLIMKSDDVAHASDPSSVAVVHGRNERLRRNMFTFLRDIRLNPIEWEQAIKRTGQGSPFIGDVVDALFRDVQAVVVLLTGDDMAQLRVELRKQTDNENEPRPQPRPNVLFEAGIAFGRMAERTVLVQIGDMREFSDIAGRHIVTLKTKADRLALANRLETAGCPVDRSGTDWLSHGNFSGTSRQRQYTSIYEKRGFLTLP